jgi:hypothetical protein
MKTTEETTLRNGRVIVFTPLANGARQADPEDGGTMNEDEWQELCRYIRQEGRVE